ncbi:MAG: hypothetical protein LBI92_11805 [Azoarcus sp.]|jgi:hypothetical protein|nr:hypothetical protein [Azoarcus sp.]
MARKIPTESGILVTCCALMLYALPAWSADAVVEGNDRAALDAAVTAAGANGTVLFGMAAGVTFGLADPAVQIGVDNLTIEGWFDSGTGGVSALATSIFNAINASRTQTASDLNTATQNALVAYLASIGGTLTGLSSITSSDPTTTRSGGVSTTFYNGRKWLALDNNISGLSLENLGIYGVTANYTSVRVVNGLIGNINTTSGDVSIGHVTGNAFDDIHIQSSGNTDQYLAGGGVIGLRSTGTSGLTGGSVDVDKVSGNIFRNVTVATTGGAYLEGGGLIGLDAVSSPAEIIGHARLGELSGNLFTNVQVSSSDILLGGGLVGSNNNSKDDTNGFDNGDYDAAANRTYASIDTITNNVFAGGITVDVAKLMRGGGVIGVHGLSNASAMIQDFSGNVFYDITVNGTPAPDSSIRGGGIVGLASNDNDLTDVKGKGTEAAADDTELKVFGDIDNSLERAPVILDNASNNLFLNLTVKAAGSIDGGGIVGLRSGRGLTGLYTLQGNVFKGLTVETTTDTGDLIGGGVVGLSSKAVSFLDDVSDNYFDDIVVNIGGNIHGGGLIGVSAVKLAGDTDTKVAVIYNITRTDFLNSTVEAGGYIDGGGIVGVTGEPGTVGGIGDPVAGIALIDASRFTGNDVTADGDILGGVVYSYGAPGMIISDSVFTGNTMTSTSGHVYGTVALDTGVANADVGDPFTLTLRATNGKTTLFRGNSIDDTEGERTNSIYFGISNDPSNNDPDPAETDAQLIIDAQAGGTVALYDPIEAHQDGTHTFDMIVNGSGGAFIWGGENSFTTEAASGGTVALLSGSNTTLLKGMTLEADNHAFSLASGGTLNVRGSNVLTLSNGSATLRGTLNFDLAGTTLDDESTTMLTIVAPSDAVDISGSTVNLLDMPANVQFQAGDEFYLIKTADTDDLTGNPVNGHDYVRSGFTQGYDFIIDKNDVNGTGDNSQYLVARLTRARPAPEGKTLLEGRAAGLAYLAQRGSWLADHSYQSADLALEDRVDEREWESFGGIDVGRFRADTGSHIDVFGTTALAGAATKKRGDNGDYLVGVFLEAGYADFKTHNTYSDIGRHVDGSGYLRAYGLGLMGRRQWDNGNRLEASLRGGRLETHFRSKDYVNAQGRAASYELEVPYAAAHLGAGHTWQLDELSDFDLLARYFWTWQQGKTVALSGTSERVNFHDSDSHRVRAGGRYTRKKQGDDKRAWYVGAAVEHEFGGKTKGHAIHQDEFDAPSLRGTNGIVQTGIIYRAHKQSPWGVELGVQGYVGAVRGVSGGIRIGREF